jgi:hypothetical protein
MNYPDTDTTQTAWSNFRQQNETERCPVTGVSRMSGYVQVEFSSAPSIGSHVESERQSKSKLGGMFDKFLYQK